MRYVTGMVQETPDQEVTKGKSRGFPMKDLISWPNIAEHMDSEWRNAIGKECLEGYTIDKSSRKQWEERNASAMKLALQVVENKSFPWVNCSNIKFPLVTIAALQFLSRVSILTRGRHLVKSDVVGPDKDGQESARAKRIDTHMSFQLLEEDREWMTDDEKAKFSASIVGSAFKKSYFDSVEGINKSEFVPASDLVVNYFTKSLDSCPRATQLLFLSRNEVAAGIRMGIYCEPSPNAYSSIPSQMDPMRTVKDTVQGEQVPAQDSNSPLAALEQHTWLDLDGDGYAEPYVVTLTESGGEVLRIVARYFDEDDVFRVNDTSVRRLKMKSAEAQETDKALSQSYDQEAIALQFAKSNSIVRIVPHTFFTKIPFIPSPDGGFYDLGFGFFMGPLNESVNSVINQLVDSGTMAVAAGGFLGRGVKIKGGKTSFDPFEWKPVDSTGNDLRQNIFPLPVREPSAVMFQLLNLLISYSEKIGGSTDIMTGISPGQNTPAETSRNTLEQGMKIFSGIYNRMYRAFGEELRKLYRLNQLYLESSPNFVALTSGANALITQDDYRAVTTRVLPAADPSVASEEQLRQKAQMVYSLAKETPGFNRYEVTKQLLDVFGVQEVEKLYPNPAGPNALPPPVNPQLELEKQKLAMEERKMMAEQQLRFVELQDKLELTRAKVIELEARAQKELAEAQGVETGHAIAALNAQIGAAKEHQAGLMESLEFVRKTLEMNLKHSQVMEGMKNENNGTGTKGMASASSDSRTPA